MKRFDLSVGQRLVAGSATIALLIAVLGVAMVLAVTRINTLQREQREVVIPRAQAARDLEVAVYQQAIALRNYVITTSASDLAAFRASEQQVVHAMERIAALPKGPDGRALFAEIQPVVAAHRRSFERLIALRRSGADSSVLQQAEAEATASRVQLIAKVQRFAAFQAAQGDRAAARIHKELDDLRSAVIVVTLLILVASYFKTLIVGRSVRQPAARLAAGAEAMRAGDYGPAMALQQERDPAGPPLRDELREVAFIFGRTAAALKLREERLAAHSRLSGFLASSLEPQTIASQSLREICAHVGAEVAALYLVQGEGQVLRPIATLALGGIEELAAGEGLPGQAAADRMTKIVRDLPEDTPFRVRLGVDQLPPRCVVATPMVVNDRVIGVIVLGTLRDLDDEHVAFVEQSAKQVAVTIDNALGHERIAQLAGELQESNEELQSQNEELQAQGEELQAQSEELQAQGEELQSQNEELQAQADELHAQQDALQQSNAALLRAEEQKNHFLAVLGHELRNPLAAISGAVALLGENGADEAQSREVVRRQTAHLASLLDDLLDIGRITSGKIVLARKPLELGAAVQRCVSLFTSNARAGAATMHFERGEAVWIDADETRVEQIVSNLLTNAQRYTPSGGTIAVSVFNEEGRGVLRVSDTGIGIEKELLPRVFDFFVQGKPGHAQNGGLGIGLTLVKTLTELHGGTVDAASPGSGKGATFTVRFNSIPAPAVSEAVASASPQLKVARSVVVVEDNADVRQMMQLWLSRAGHEVSEAHDGPSGVDVVTASKPDVALIDLDLPGFDGCEVARRLRQDPAISRVRLIAVSGYGRPEDRDRALAAGFDDHLVKPLDLGQLSEALRQSQEGG